jgi:hypothetical protein
MHEAPNQVVLYYPDIRSQSYFGSLHLVNGLVNIRSIFRSADYAKGYDGHLQSHKVFFYILDTLSVLILAFWINRQHPGEIALLLRKYCPPKNAETVMD